MHGPPKTLSRSRGGAATLQRVALHFPTKVFGEENWGGVEREREKAKAKGRAKKKEGAKPIDEEKQPIETCCLSAFLGG